MKREKSCGALVYRYDSGRLLLLLLRHRHGGHWSFPKGHVEGSETEVETALREVQEETGLHVSLQRGFRHTVEYYPKPGVKKQVVYFLGKALPNEPVVRQEIEISELKWVEWDEACRCVTYKNDRDLLNMAKTHLEAENMVC